MHELTQDLSQHDCLDPSPNDDGKDRPTSPPHHSQEELAKARSAEREAAQQLERALFRCAKTEESLARACDERLFFETALREAEGVRDAYAKELSSLDRMPVLAMESRDVTSQTSETNKQKCDLDQSFLRLKEDLELARIDLDASKKQTADLQQQLSDLTAETNRAMHEARHNNELAEARQKEITSISEREQVRPGPSRWTSERLQAHDLKYKITSTWFSSQVWFLNGDSSYFDA